MAIIVVNYASHRLLSRNLAGVSGENPEAAIIVVDSFSGNAEQAAVQDLARSHDWTLVKTTSNVGFGAGMNVGVAEALKMGATSFLLLNPDAVISRKSLGVLQRRLDENPLALLSPRILDAGGNTWFAGADLRLDNGRTQSSARTLKDVDKGRQAPTWPWLSGACLLVSKELWLLTGGFDERFFLYWEDVDFSRRVMCAGGTLALVADASSIHDEGGTQKPHTNASASLPSDAIEQPTPPHRGKSRQYYYYNTRNRLLFAALHLPRDSSRQWVRSALPAAWEILMRGGRRQLLHSLIPLQAVLNGTWDGLRLARHVRREHPSPTILHSAGRCP